MLIIVVSLLSIFLNTVVSMMLTRAGNLTIPSVGNIKTIGVEAYWDPACETKTEAIDWGPIWLGTTKNVTLYLRSVSNVKTFLILDSTEIDPIELSNGITLSWNYDGSFIEPDEIVEVTLFLRFSDDDYFIHHIIEEHVGNFSFDIYISTTE